jgi:antitoxin (DNA-binding transcriptional repressor) of toxin-antitoxin stability system
VQAFGDGRTAGATTRRLLGFDKSPHYPFLRNVRNERRRERSGAARRVLRSVSATEAAKRLGALVDKVREQGATFVIERAGVPVARIGPVKESRCTVTDLVTHLRAMRGHDDAFAQEVRAGIRRLNAPAVPRDPWGS